MSAERYSIVFSSVTGNTRQLAEAIRESLPETGCDYFGLCSAEALKSEMLYVGFWTDKGNADEASQALLKTLKNKKIFLFGTAGFGISEAYFRRVLDNVRLSIDESNIIVGEYMCQGKMPQSVRERYVALKAQPQHPANIDALIENFDLALSHPDAADLDKLKKLVQE